MCAYSLFIALLWTHTAAAAHMCQFVIKYDIYIFSPVQIIIRTVVIYRIHHIVICKGWWSFICKIKYFLRNRGGKIFEVETPSYSIKVPLLYYYTYIEKRENRKYRKKFPGRKDRYVYSLLSLSLSLSSIYRTHAYIYIYTLGYCHINRRYWKSVSSPLLSASANTPQRFSSLSLFYLFFFKKSYIICKGEEEKSFDLYSNNPVGRRRKCSRHLERGGQSSNSNKNYAQHTTTCILCVYYVVKTEQRSSSRFSPLETTFFLFDIYLFLCDVYTRGSWTFRLYTAAALNEMFNS